MRLDEIQVYNRDDMRNGVRHFRAVNPKEGGSADKMVGIYLGTDERVGAVWYDSEDEYYVGTAYLGSIARKAEIQPGQVVKVGVNRFAARSWIEQTFGRQARIRLEDKQ